MKTSMMMVSPDLAKKWLADDAAFYDLHIGMQIIRNRDVRRHKVSYWKGIIDADQWITTHQGFAISPEGQILDGRHRINAIALGEKSVLVMVTLDCPVEAFAAMDRGMSRSQADALSAPSRIVDTAKMIAALSIGRTSNYRTVPDHLIQKMIGMFPEIQKTFDTFRRNSKRSTLAVRAAFCVCLVEFPHLTDKLAEVADQFNNMAEDCPSVVWSLIKQVDRGTTGPKDFEDYFARSMVLFRPASWGLSVLKINDVETWFVHASTVIMKAVRERQQG